MSKDAQRITTNQNDQKDAERNVVTLYESTIGATSLSKSVLAYG